MGVFDSLIDKGQEPKVGMEYIYVLDMAWPIYRKGDDRPTDLHNIYDKEPKKGDPEVHSQEELDNLSYKPYSIKVKEGIIVIDVVSKKSDNGYHLGYDFTIKESGIRCHCNYPWAFWENTPENLIKIEEYKVENEKLKEQEKKVKKLRKNIDQLSLK